MDDTISSTGTTNTSFDINRPVGASAPAQSSAPSTRSGDQPLPPASVVFGDREEDQFEGESDGEYIERTGMFPDPYKRAVKGRLGAAGPAPAPQGLLPEQKSSQKFEDDGVTPFEVRDPFGEPDDAPESFDEFRYQKGVPLEVPAILAKDARFDEAEVQSVTRDVGVIAARSGMDAEFAQSVFNVLAESYAPPPAGGFTEEACWSELRRVTSADAEKLADAAAKYTSSRPALAAWLDETGMGNNAQVVMALAALQNRPGLATKQGAEAYIAEVFKKNDSPLSKAYFGGDKFEAFVARLAFAIASGGK